MMLILTVLAIQIKFYLHKVMDYLVIIINILKYQMITKNPRMIMIMMLIVVEINQSVHNFWIKKYEICNR